MNIIKQNVEISLKDNLSQNPNGKTWESKHCNIYPSTTWNIELYNQLS
jgi:hypothetical protein